MYIKATDCPQYLHYLSSHPEHTKWSIFCSHTLRTNRLCSLENDFNYHKLNINGFLLKGIILKLLRKFFLRSLAYLSKDKTLKELRKKVAVVTYHPLLIKVTSRIQRKVYLLYLNQEVKSIFTPMSIVSFRSTSRIISYCLRGKLYPLNKSIGFEKFGKNEVCWIIEELYEHYNRQMLQDKQ